MNLLIMVPKLVDAVNVANSLAGLVGRICLSSLTLPVFPQQLQQQEGKHLYSRKEGTRPENSRSKNRYKNILPRE